MSEFLENSAVATRLEKVSFLFYFFKILIGGYLLHNIVLGKERSVLIPIPKKGNAKECSNYHTNALISRASKVILKILQAWLSSTWTKNLQILRRQRNQRSNCQHLLDHRESKGIPEKSSASLTNLKSLAVWITANCGKFLKGLEY